MSVTCPPSVIYPTTTAVVVCIPLFFSPRAPSRRSYRAGVRRRRQARCPMLFLMHSPEIHCYVAWQRNPDNVMRKVKCDKLVINIAVGESGDRLTKAIRVLQQLSDQTPVESVGEHCPCPSLPGRCRCGSGKQCSVDRLLEGKGGRGHAKRGVESSSERSGRVSWTRCCEREMWL